MLFSIIDDWRSTPAFVQYLRFCCILEKLSATDIFFVTGAFADETFEVEPDFSLFLLTLLSFCWLVTTKSVGSTKKDLEWGCGPLAIVFPREAELLSFFLILSILNS